MNLYVLDYILYGLFGLSILVARFAQIKVSLTFRRYAKKTAVPGMTAADGVRRLLDGAGLSEVSVDRVRGNLTDHYDPRDNTIRLSESVYDSDSVAALGVAAHETGHAIQHAENYLPIVIRQKLVPVTTFASHASWIFILIGLIFSSGAFLGNVFLLIGVGLFAVTTLFQLVTLPCEFNASHRALVLIKNDLGLGDREVREVRRVLSAAAMTYVAALFTSLLQLARLLILFAGNNSRRKR